MKILGMIDQNDCETCSVVGLLSDRFLFVPFDYQIRNGKLETSVDAVYWAGTECPDTADVSLLKELGVRQVGMTRMTKLEQHLVLTRLGIPCPEYYNAHTRYAFQASSLLEDMDDDTQLVVKSFYGARGLQQFLIRRGTLVRSFYPGADMKAGKKQGRLIDRLGIKKQELARVEDTVEIPEKAEVVLGGDEKENGPSKYFFEGKDLKSWLITKRVPVQHEYRVIAFRGAGLMWCEWHVNLGHFQNNLAVGTEVSYLGVDFNVNVPEGVQAAAARFADAIQKEHPTAPFFSMDVYLSDSGEIGLFEYSGEFGFAAMDFDELRKRAVAAIDLLLK